MSERRTAIVTGGGSGIGLAISERLATDGARVAVFDRNGPAAEEAETKLRAAGASALGLEVDVTDRARVEAAAAEVRQRLGAPTILANSAGLDAFEPFLSITVESWTRIQNVNLTGTFHCCQVVLPDMIEAGWGRIVNISSSSAQTGAIRMAHYASAKAGVIGLTKALALEFASRGITVNTVPPGFVDTPMLRAAAAEGQMGKGGIDAVAAMIPVRRAGRPEDIAAACAYLVSDEAGYVTGQILGVNGGRVL